MADSLRADTYQGRNGNLPRIAWAPESTVLQVNLVALDPAAAIESHVNAALDVVMTCFGHAGTLVIDESLSRSCLATLRWYQWAQHIVLLQATTDFGTPPATANAAG